MEDEGPIKVSVLCLAYNHEKYIRKTLEGFVKQKTNFKFEVLIHDDASTDHTADIIAEFAKKYPDLIKPIYQTENQHSKGVKIQHTYNYSRAKGEYFAWCEGDDYWCDEQKLQKQYDAMENHPECSICVHKVQCINEDGSKNERIIPEKFYGLKGEGVLSDDNVAKAFWLKKWHYPFQTSSYFVRRESLQDLIDDNLNYVDYMTGDHVILLTVLSKGHVFYINQIMSCYRLFSKGSYTSNRETWTEIENRNSVLKKAKGDLLFDEYTSGRYHAPIFQSISNTVIRYGAQTPEQLDHYLNYLNMQKADVLSNCSIRGKLIYYLSIYAHPVYSFLRGFWHRIKNINIIL